MSLFGSAGGLAGLGLAEDIGVGTVSPEDVAAEHQGKHVNANVWQGNFPYQN